MKICILFTFYTGPYGGGNQFLKALKNKFVEMGYYTQNSEEADIFLFNSFQDINLVLKMKRRFPNAIFVHRVDGPITLYRNSSSTALDRLIYQLNTEIADATVFQSKYSQEANRNLGIPFQSYEKIIINAPDNNIFYPKKNGSNDHEKIRLISVSWSSNPMKGFDVYQYLDDHLNFEQYDYVFIGNSPVIFKHIKITAPLPSEAIAEQLRSSHIYITASRKDPCSNSLIEALACGLPSIAINDGGHPELVGEGGEIFDHPEEIPAKIETIMTQYDTYRKKIPVYDIASTAHHYIIFFRHLIQEKKSGTLKPKNISYSKMCSLGIKSLLENL